MRQVRKKSVDPAARSYLLKAKNEGLVLSWTRFENMLPQDGFGKLGLLCSDCMQGPCRLNPYSQKEERTICGRGKDDLVLHNLLRLVTKKSRQYVSFDNSNRQNAANVLIEAAHAELKDLTSNGKTLEKGFTQKIGLGVLEKDAVNICLESVSSAVLELCIELAKELKPEAESKGATGFNLVIAGDVTTDIQFPTATNAGGVEFALLTGLVDLYAVGSSGLGLGKNVVPSYHTVYRDADKNPEKEQIKDWFIQAAVAYSKRDTEKILISEQNEKAQLLAIDPSMLKAHVEQESFKKICVVAGGSNVLVTQDELLCKTVRTMASEDVLCVTYGNAAATLGKYGLLSPGADGASQRVSDALGMDKGAPAYWIGSESELLDILNWVNEIGADNFVAVVPELSTSEDLRAALVFAGKGVKVFTAVRLPIDGSMAVAKEVDKLICYYEPKDFVAQIVAEVQS